MNEFLRAALSYAQRGWHILPCRPGGKTPLTAHGVHDASRGEATLRSWWTQWPTANVAVACGPSLLVVLDADSRHGGMESLRDLCQQLGREAFETPTVETGGGGLHVYFARDGQDIGNSAGKLGAGLDIKADGGYVIAPPSIHPDGRLYGWALGYSPDERELLPFPSALAERLRAHSARAPDWLGGPPPCKN